jgi:hypothetical protein
MEEINLGNGRVRLGRHIFHDLPDHVKLIVLLEMICPDGHIHRVPAELARIREDGILSQVESLTALMTEEGWRPATEEDLKKAQQAEAAEVYTKFLEQYKSTDSRGDA